MLAILICANPARSQQALEAQSDPARTLLQSLFGPGTESQERFDAWYWMAHGARYTPFLMHPNRTADKNPRNESIATDDGLGLAAALLQESAANLTTATFADPLLGLLGRQQPYEVKLFDPLTNALLRVGADQPLDAERFAAIQRAVEQHLARTPDIEHTISLFLATRFDVPFGEHADDDGQQTLRLQLLETLSGNGRGKSAPALARELRATTSAEEIIAIAQMLDRFEPGRYAEDILHAVRDMLAANTMVAGSDLETTLQAIVATQRAKVARSTRSTARTPRRTAPKTPTAEEQPAQADAAENIPGANDVKALITAARTQGESDLRFRAMQILGRVSSQNAQARAELIRQAESNQIPEDFWPDIAIAIAGLDTRTTPDPDDSDMRIDVIAELLEATDDDAAIDALEEAAALLEDEDYEEDEEFLADEAFDE